MRSTLLIRLAAGTLLSLSVALPGIASAQTPTATPTETATATATATATPTGTASPTATPDPESVKAAIVLFAKGPDLTAVRDRLDALLAAIDEATGGEYKAHISIVTNSEGDDVLRAVVKAKGDASLEGLVNGFVTDVQALPGVEVKAKVKPHDEARHDGDDGEDDDDGEGHDGEFKFGRGDFGVERAADGTLTITTPFGTITVKPGEPPTFVPTATATATGGSITFGANGGAGIAEGARKLGESNNRSSGKSQSSAKSGDHRD